MQVKAHARPSTQPGLTDRHDAGCAVARLPLGPPWMTHPALSPGPARTDCPLLCLQDAPTPHKLCSAGHLQRDDEMKGQTRRTLVVKGIVSPVLTELSCPVSSFCGPAAVGESKRLRLDPCCLGAGPAKGTKNRRWVSPGQMAPCRNFNRRVHMSNEPMVHAGGPCLLCQG